MDITATHTTPARRRIGPLLLFAIGAILVLGGIGWLTLTGGEIRVPDSLAGWPLSEQVTGPEALRQIERLHGKGFPLTDGAVAHYGGNRATLWISSTWLPVMAARQVEAMADRIAEGQSPFTPTGQEVIEGKTVYTLSGMGQTHYYFQHKRLVIWLAASPSIARQSLTDLLQSLP